MTRFSYALAFAALVPATGWSQTVTVGNRDNYEPISTSYDRSTGYQSTWGQTFRTPDATMTRLDSWSFWQFGPTLPTAPLLTSVLEIWEWSAGLVGEALFTSAPVTPTVPFNTGGRDEEFKFTYDIGLTLDPMKTYLTFLRPVSMSGGDPSITTATNGLYYACGGQNCASIYPDGAMIGLRSSQDETGAYRPLVDQPLVSVMNGFYDTRFEATFSAPITPVPEPATLTMLSAGILAIGAFRRRQQRGARRGTSAERLPGRVGQR